MNNYQHIMAAIDFSDSAEAVIIRAKQLADCYQARLSIVHVVDYMLASDFAYGDLGTLGLSLEQQKQVEEVAWDKLEKLCKQFELGLANREILRGVAKTEIADFVQQHHVDLVMLGSHGHHGLKALLGSTVDGVLHSVDCDVLTIRTLRQR